MGRAGRAVRDAAVDQRRQHDPQCGPSVDRPGAWCQLDPAPVDRRRLRRRIRRISPLVRVRSGTGWAGSGCSMCGSITFAGGSSMAASLGRPDSLMVARGFMGIGAARLMPCTLSILTNVFTGARRPCSGHRRVVGDHRYRGGRRPHPGRVAAGPLLVGIGVPRQRPHRTRGLVAAALVVPNSQEPEGRAPGSHGCPAIDRRPGSVAVGHHRGAQSRLDLSGDRGRTGRGHPRPRRLCLVGAPQRPPHAALAVLCQPTI